MTIFSYGRMVAFCLRAAEALQKEGVDAEVIDLRTLVPLDLDTMVRSARKTGKVLIVQEAFQTGGYAGEIYAQVSDSEAFYYLEAPIKRLCGSGYPGKTVKPA